MDHIFIKNLVARGIIGLNDWERDKAQEIIINVVLFVDIHEAGVSDAIDDSVNYRTIAKKLLMHVETVKRFTVEALATATLLASALMIGVCTRCAYSWRNQELCDFQVLSV